MVLALVTEWGLVFEVEICGFEVSWVWLCAGQVFVLVGVLMVIVAQNVLLSTSLRLSEGTLFLPRVQRRDDLASSVRRWRR